MATSDLVIGGGWGFGNTDRAVARGLPVARPNVPGGFEHWGRKPPEQLTRLTEAVGPGTPWRDADAAVEAAMRGEQEVWVPCGDLQYLDGRFPCPIREPFGSLDRGDLARLLRDGHARVHRLALSGGAAMLLEPVEVTVPSLFIALQPDAAPATPRSRKPRPRVPKTRGKPVARNTRGSAADAPATAAAAKAPTPAEIAPPAEKKSAEGQAAGRPPTAPTETPTVTDSPPPVRRPDGPDRMLRQPEVCTITGLSRTTIWRLESLGGFPRRRRLGRQAVGWMESDVRAWVETRVQGGPDVGERARGEGG